MTTINSINGSFIGATLTSVESDYTQRIFLPPTPGDDSLGAFYCCKCVSDTAYFVYCGRTTAPITPKFVEVYTYNDATNAGSATQEVGIFSSVNPPNKSAQTLTKIVATSSFLNSPDSGVLYTPQMNASAFTTLIPAGTHIWAGIRYHNWTGISNIGLENDMGQGWCVVTAGASALTGAGPWTGAIQTNFQNGQWGATIAGPYLRITLD